MFALGLLYLVVGKVVFRNRHFIGGQRYFETRGFLGFLNTASALCSEHSYRGPDNARRGGYGGIRVKIGARFGFSVAASLGSFSGRFDEMVNSDFCL